MNIKATIYLKDKGTTTVGIIPNTTLEAETKRFVDAMNASTITISDEGKLLIVPIDNVSLIELEEVE